MVACMPYSDMGWQDSVMCMLAPCTCHACSDAVAIEVLGRQLANRGGQDALLSLCPWLEFITIPTQGGRKGED